MAYLRRWHRFHVSNHLYRDANCLSYTRYSSVAEHSSSEATKKFQTRTERHIFTQLEKQLRYGKYANGAPFLPKKHLNLENIPVHGVNLFRTSCLGLLWNFTQRFSSRAQNRNTGSRPVHYAGDEDDQMEDVDAEHTGLSEAEDEYEDGEDYVEEEEEYEEEEQEGPKQKEVKKKPDKKFTKPTSKSSEQQGRVLNEDITADTVRLVIDGEGHQIVSRKEALRYAKAQNLDLVQVDGRAKPPVCKVFNFHKEEYKQEQIQKDRKKKKMEMLRLNDIKELRFTSKTELKDVKMKVDKAKMFMDRGHRVKFVAIFKGPDDEKKRVEQEKMINDIIKMVEDIATIDQGPRIEARQAWVMLRHVKFGGTKKKASQASKPEAVIEEVWTSSSVGKDVPSDEPQRGFQEESQSEDQTKRAGIKLSEKQMHPHVSAIPFHSPPVDSGLSQVTEFSWIPNSNEQANPRSTSEGFSKPSSRGPLRHSPGSTPCAQESDGIPEAYGNFRKRSSQRLENIEAVQRSEQSLKHDSTTPTSRIAQVPQGQGVSRLSPQKHGHGASGLSSQDYGQGGPVLPSQGRGKGVSSEGLGQQFRPQGRGQGLPSQSRGQVDAEPSSPLLDFFSSAESQPLQGPLPNRMTKSANPPIGHLREPLRRKSGEYDLGHDKALHQKHSYDSFASKHASENDRMTISQGHGRGSLKMPSQGRGQGNQQVPSQGYPARRQGQEGEDYPTNRPSFQSRSPGHLSSHRSAQQGNENNETQDKPFQRNRDKM